MLAKFVVKIIDTDGAWLDIEVEMPGGTLTASVTTDGTYMDSIGFVPSGELWTAIKAEVTPHG